MTEIFTDGRRKVTNYIAAPFLGKVEYPFRQYQISIIHMNFTENLGSDDACYIEITDQEGRKFNNIGHMEDYDYLSFDHWLSNAEGYQRRLDAGANTKNGRHIRVIVQFTPAISDKEPLRCHVSNESRSTELVFQRM